MRIATLIMLLGAMISALAATPNFSNTRGILYLPNMTVDGQTVLYDMEIVVDLEAQQIIEVLRWPTLTSPCSTPIPVSFGEHFWLAIGQCALVEGTNITLKFNKVTEDSRCPLDTECFWEGQVTTSLTLSQGKVKSPLALTLATPNNQTVNGVKVTLLEVDPYPQFSPPPSINSAAYAARLSIEQVAPMGTPTNPPIIEFMAPAEEAADNFLEEFVEP